MIGETKRNTYGTEMKIVADCGNGRVDVQFCDSHAAVVNTAYVNFKRGTVKNPYDRTVFQTGYLGEGPYLTKVNGKCPISNLVWMAMIQRCYSEKWKDQHAAYYGICTVSDEWLNYQHFATWYEENQYEVNGRLHLDKDILVPGNKVYSAETCLLVPQRINMLFMSKKRKKDADLPTGLHRVFTKDAVKFRSCYNTVELGTFNTIEEAYDSYVRAKERHIREVADEYKNIIPQKVYDALVGYQCPQLTIKS